MRTHGNGGFRAIGGQPWGTLFQEIGKRHGLIRSRLGGGKACFQSPDFVTQNGGFLVVFRLQHTAQKRALHLQVGPQTFAGVIKAGDFPFVVHRAVLNEKKGIEVLGKGAIALGATGRARVQQALQGGAAVGTGTVFAHGLFDHAPRGLAPVDGARPRELEARGLSLMLLGEAGRAQVALLDMAVHDFGIACRGDVLVAILTKHGLFSFLSIPSGRKTGPCFEKTSGDDLRYSARRACFTRKRMRPCPSGLGETSVPPAYRFLCRRKSGGKESFMLRGLIGFVLCAGVMAAPGAPVLQLSAAPPTQRVRPERAVAAGASAEVAAARNEVESFQVVVRAAGGNVEGITGAMSALSGPDYTFPAGAVEVFREVFVPVRHSAPRATEAPGWISDPLVPLLHPVTGEVIAGPRWDGKQVTGAQFGGMPFSVWEERNEVFWCDVHVPKEAPAGVYTGVFRVSAKNVPDAELPVRLEVWDFALPDGPTHENHFGGVNRAAAYWGLKAGDEAFAPIEEAFIAMMAGHRINPPLRHDLHPAIQEDGSAVFDEDLDARFSEFVDRYHLTNIDVPRAPFPDVLGADREKAKDFYRSWYAYLDTKGWADRAYLYMLDEPNDPEAYERVRQLGALVHEAEPRLRCLVVEQPYTQDPAWGTLDDAIDIWCPLFGFVHEPSVLRVQAQGDEVWTYSALVQTAPPYHPEYEAVRDDLPPFWQIDFPVTSYRIAPWLNRRYGITGLLYWSVVYWGSPDRNPWLDPGFRIRWNGDGFLFYPGKEIGIDGPIASIRLKNLRDGLEDYEYFVLLEELGGAEAVDAAVREAVPTWGAWKQDPETLLELRRRLAGEIVRRSSSAR